MSFFRGCTAKPSVKYAENITTSPQSAAETFSLQHSSSHHTNDNDPDSEAHSPFHAPLPRSTSEPQHGRRRTSAQSSRRRATWGGRRPIAEVDTDPKEKASPKAPLLERVRTTMSTLFVPEHKVGKPPGLARELRTIIFGSCE